ncbi:hypothetical protein LLG95_03410 [bacterium]|nr:hypothetical protein [bacterium]
MNGSKSGHGIFCLEGDWSTDLRKKTSVEPLLKIVADAHFRKFPYIHRRIGTKEELIFALKKWTQSMYARYSILYLAFHGEESCICLDGKRMVFLDEIKPIIEDCERNVVIYFGSCSTMQANLKTLRKFMENTNIIGIIGFSEEVDWFKSTAFDLMVIRELQDRPRLTAKSLTILYDNLRIDLMRSAFYSDLGFRLILNE